MTTSALALPFLCLLCVLHSLPTSCSIPSSSPSSLHISSPSILSITFIHLFFLPPISNISASPFISSFEIASFFILSLCQAWFNHDHLDGNNSILTGYQAPIHDCAYPNTDINHIMSFLCLEPSNGFSSDSEQRPKPLAGPLATLSSLLIL